MKTYIYLKIFQFSCRIYCMLTLSLVSVALFFVTTFPVKAKIRSNGVLEKGMKKIFLANVVSLGYLV